MRCIVQDAHSYLYLCCCCPFIDDLEFSCDWNSLAVPKVMIRQIDRLLMGLVSGLSVWDRRRAISKSVERNDLSSDTYPENALDSIFKGGKGEKSNNSDDIE